MSLEHIDTIRAFNRRYTQAMGLLSRDFLGTSRSVTELRVLFDIMHEPGSGMRNMAHRLDIDEGYLSRIIDSFEAEGWVEKRPEAADKRRRAVSMTADGQREMEAVIDAQRNDIGTRLQSLGQSPRTVAEVASQLEALLTPISREDVRFRDLQTGDIGWLIERHALHYRDSDGFDETFEALVAEILVDFLRKRDPDQERAWIATTGTRRLGSIFCVRDARPSTAKIRLFYLEADVRGIGLGRALLSKAMDFARNRGFQRLRLMTHESHAAAGRTYAAAGFSLTDAQPKRSFGVDVVEQVWERDLT